MAITDFGGAINKVRALIPDIELLDSPADPDAAPEYLFSDAHLQAFLDLNAASPRRAAADACEVLGTSEALISKVIQTDDLKTDGAKVMQQFLARAKILRDTSEAEVAGDLEIIPSYAQMSLWPGSAWPC